MTTFRISAVLAAALFAATAASAAEAPGVTATSIKIGQTTAYSGPASQYGLIGKVEGAYFDAVNEAGGVNGRKIEFLSVDDGYSPPKSVEAVRKLVEQDGVAFMFNSFGAPTNAAQAKYLNLNKVPQLFVGTGGYAWGDVEKVPWSMGWQPSFRTEGQIYARYILSKNPAARIGVLYQNDDFGKDYVAGVKDVLGTANAALLVEAVSYEPTDPTVDSQIITLQGANVDAFVLAAIPKVAAQTLRKAYDLGWKPTVFVTSGASGVEATMAPAKGRTDIPVISGGFLKDANDPRWADDPGVKDYRAFVEKRLPGANANDFLPVYGYTLAQTIVEVLKLCGDDLSRANILRQASSLHDVALPLLLPGITLNTGPADHYPIKQEQLAQWDGQRWQAVGSVIDVTQK